MSPRFVAERGFPECSGSKDRERRAPVAIASLAEYEGADRFVRFDNVSPVAFGEDKAFLCHHINTLSDAIPDDAGNMPP